MSEQRNDGGPAFPAPHYPGMTLRDWFAGQILPAIWSDDAPTDGEGMTLPEIAEEAYRMADYMLSERQKS